MLRRSSRAGGEAAARREERRSSTASNAINTKSHAPRYARHRGDDRILTKECFEIMLRTAEVFGDPRPLLQWVDRNDGWFVGRGAKKKVVEGVLKVMERRGWRGKVAIRCAEEERLRRFLGNKVEEVEVKESKEKELPRSASYFRAFLLPDQHSRFRGSMLSATSPPPAESIEPKKKSLVVMGPSCGVAR